MITDLLFEAAMHFSNMSNPAGLGNSEAALDEVRQFISVEEKILAVPGAIEELEKLVFLPLDPTGNTQNHAMMAGLILARSGWPSSASVLLSAARHPDQWCAVQARLNLSWLVPSEETATLLQNEIRRQKKEGLSEIPIIVLIDALIHQKATETLPTINSYIEDEDSETNRATILTSLVNLWPEHGLQVAENLGKAKPSLLTLTALGLRAVYVDYESYGALLNYSFAQDDLEGTIFRWLGRIPCPESLPQLLKGLDHPSIAVRCDVVTSLALLGLKDSYEAVVRSLFDPAKEVADQSMALSFQWFSDDLASLTQQWTFDSHGRLDVTSSRKLEQLVRSSLSRLETELHYLGNSPWLPVYNLEQLYRGLLPDHSWHHWVSITGSYQPYDTRKPVLYNYPSLEKLEDWHLAHKADFVPGGFYYHGRPCGRGSGERSNI